jgi:hypothetical protein
MTSISMLEIVVEELDSALGARVVAYPGPSVAPLVEKVIAQLRDLIARGAPDSETGAVLDPVIEAWYRGELAALATLRTQHEQAAEELVIQAEALVGQAAALSKQAASDLQDARRQHASTMTELESVQAVGAPQRI